MPVVGVAGEDDRDGVRHVHGDLAGRSYDLDVVLGDRQLVFFRFGEDGGLDAFIVVRAGPLRLVHNGLPQLGRFHLHWNHLPRHEDGQTKKDEADQTAELTLTALATTLAHNDLRRGEYPYWMSLKKRGVGDGVSGVGDDGAVG